MLDGDRVIKSAVSVWEIMATEWCRECLYADEGLRIVEAVKDLLAVGKQAP